MNKDNIYINKIIESNLNIIKNKNFNDKDLISIKSFFKVLFEINNINSSLDDFYNDLLYTYTLKIKYEKNRLIIKIKNGKTHSLIVIYYDDYSDAYFFNIYVDKNERNKGNGNKLLHFMEILCILYGIKKSYLFANKDKWIYNWYERHGYKYFPENKDSYDWLVKNLNLDKDKE